MPTLFQIPAAHTLQEVLEHILFGVDEALPIHERYDYGFYIVVI